MNDCQVNESQKLFVLGSFQFRVGVCTGVAVLLLVLVQLPFASSLSRKTDRLPCLASCFQ